jgi:Zn finger protein HypA/HybF involved in hydrogenase expression
MGNGLIIGCNKCISEKDHNKVGRDPNIKGTYFDIMEGGLMFCFCKEQLEKIYGINKKYDRNYRLLAVGDPPEEIYSIMEKPTDDEEIDKIIYKKINEGYEFTDNLSHSAYYCESCKKLFNRFYFEMKKDNDIYTPNYKCQKCSNVLMLSSIEWEKNEEDKYEDDNEDEFYEKIKYKFIINRNFIIKSNEENIELICDNCGNDEFSIMSTYFAD